MTLGRPIPDALGGAWAGKPLLGIRVEFAPDAIRLRFEGCAPFTIAVGDYQKNLLAGLGIQAEQFHPKFFQVIVLAVYRRLTGIAQVRYPEIMALSAWQEKHHVYERNIPRTIQRCFATKCNEPGALFAHEDGALILKLPARRIEMDLEAAQRHLKFSSSLEGVQAADPLLVAADRRDSAKYEAPTVASPGHQMQRERDTSEVDPPPDQDTSRQPKTEVARELSSAHSGPGPSQAVRTRGRIWRRYRGAISLSALGCVLAAVGYLISHPMNLSNPAGAPRQNSARWQGFPVGEGGSFDGSSSPLRSNEGLWFAWKDTEAVSKFGGRYYPGGRDLTDGGRTSQLSSNLFYVGSRNTREVFMSFEDRGGKVEVRREILKRGVWTPITTSIKHLEESGVDVRAVAQIEIQVPNVVRGESGSIALVGLIEPQFAPLSTVVPKIPPTFAGQHAAKELRGTVGVVPALRAVAESGEKITVAFFRDDEDARFLHLIEQHFLARPTFPIDFVASRDDKDVSFEGPIRAVAALKVGQQVITGEYRGIFVDRPISVVLGKMASGIVDSIPRQEDLAFLGGSLREAAAHDFEPLRAENACNNGDRNACYQLGLRYESGASVPRDATHAASLWRRSCDLGLMDACNALAVLYVRGTGVDRSGERAAAFFKVACDGGNAAGCSNLGLLYEREPEIGGSPTEASKLYRQGCDGKDALACFSLGRMYLDGKAVQRDQQLASELLMRACDASIPEACQVLGGMYLDETRGIADPARAAKYLGRACSGGNADGCCGLGVLHDFGKGVDRDFSQAEQLYLLGCAGNSGCACNNLGRMYEEGRFGVQQDLAKASDLARRACDLKLAVGCANRARLLLEMPGSDLALAEDAAQKNGTGCYVLGDLSLRGGNPKRAAVLFEQACALGERAACDRVQNPGGATHLSLPPVAPPQH